MFNGYLPVGKSLHTKISFRTLKQCSYGQERRLSSKKQFYSMCGLPKPLNRNLVYKLKQPPLLIQKNTVFTLPPARTNLMNMEVVKIPSIFHSLNTIANGLFIKTLDEEFDMKEFVISSKTALVVVAKLLSEVKFSELDGLLTTECLQEVEKNVRAIPLHKRRDLVIELEDIYYSFPYYTKIIKGGNEGEKIYFEVTVVHHVCKNYASVMNKNAWEQLSHAKREMLSIYNCRFIKEFTKGVNDNWIMNGINVYKLEELNY